MSEGAAGAAASAATDGPPPPPPPRTAAGGSRAVLRQRPKPPPRSLTLKDKLFVGGTVVVAAVIIGMMGNLVGVMFGMWGESLVSHFALVPLAALGGGSFVFTVASFQPALQGHTEIGSNALTAMGVNGMVCCIGSLWALMRFETLQDRVAATITVLIIVTFISSVVVWFLPGAPIRTVRGARPPPAPAPSAAKAPPAEPPAKEPSAAEKKQQ